MRVVHCESNRLITERRRRTRSRRSVSSRFASPRVTPRFSLPCDETRRYLAEIDPPARPRRLPRRLHARTPLPPVTFPGKNKLIDGLRVFGELDSADYRAIGI